MANQEILEKAIQKARENGWDTSHFKTLKADYKHPDESEFHDLLSDWHSISPLDIIFNHDFAKALWGVEPITEHVGYKASLTRPAFAFHLQQMVISSDPLEYLGENV